MHVILFERNNMDQIYENRKATKVRLRQGLRELSTSLNNAEALELFEKQCETDWQGVYPIFYQQVAHRDRLYQLLLAIKNEKAIWQNQCHYFKTINETTLMREAGGHIEQYDSLENQCRQLLAQQANCVGKILLKMLEMQAIKQTKQDIENQLYLSRKRLSEIHDSDDPSSTDASIFIEFYTAALENFGTEHD